MIKPCELCHKLFTTHRATTKTCSDQCNRKRHAVLLTGKHRNIDCRGSKNSNWKGGRSIDGDGYCLIFAPHHPFRNRAGYVREHRLVMEQVCGRFLTKEEIVHHRNGNPQDNSLENLVLLKKRQHDYHHYVDRPKDIRTGRFVHQSQ